MKNLVKNSNFKIILIVCMISLIIILCLLNHIISLNIEIKNQEREISISKGLNNKYYLEVVEIKDLEENRKGYKMKDIYSGELLTYYIELNDEIQKGEYNTKIGDQFEINSITDFKYQGEINYESIVIHNYTKLIKNN